MLRILHGRIGAALQPVALAAVALSLTGCAITWVHQGDRQTLQASRPGRVIVFGRINYVIDGKSKAPYGAFRPRWPAPIMNATRLEDGSALHSPAVAKQDGRFLWELPPGHYVITRLGVGQFVDDTYLAWPRIAFQVPDSRTPVYLGHLVLAGTSFTNEFTYSTGRTSRFLDIDYQLEVRDELAEHAARFPAVVRGTAPQPASSLMFHDGAMPIGDRLVELWRKSPADLITRIFPNRPKSASSEISQMDSAARDGAMRPTHFR